MILELMTAVLLGVLVLWLALGALGTRPVSDEIAEADPIDETPRGRALLAIKELEFDRETGKVSEDDFQTIRGRLATEAMQVLGSAGPATAATTATACRTCGPRPETGARFCSACGGPVG